MIRLNSDELKAWHEVGHATVCLHLGGDLDGIEFLEGSSQGFAVARGCEVAPENERSVACGGFAAEFYLLQAGYVDAGDLKDSSVLASVSTLAFSNAWMDRQAFAGRLVTEDDDFTKKEDEEFMHYAIKHVAPIFNLYLAKMQVVVRELLAKRRIDGVRVRELLQISIPSERAARWPHA